MQAVIMAGGKGTRLSSITKDIIPKPMVPFCGKPLIERLVEQMAQNDITDMVICLGHLGKQISQYLGDGKRYGVSIHYVQEDVPLGTAGALYYAKEYIYEDFVLVYADLMLDINLERMYLYHKTNNAMATLFVHPNSHPFDSDLVIHDAEGRVKELDFKDHVRNYDYDNCVNAGVFIFSPEVLSYFGYPEKVALEKGLILNLLQRNKRVFAYFSPEYVKDVGTPERLAVSEVEYHLGKIERRNLRHKQKAVFIDRDGTLNAFKGLITSPEQIEIITGVDEALCRLNKSEYLVLVVTNQPVVARGDCTELQIDEIHKRLYTLLGNRGTFVDDLKYCPHHTDKGFPGERPELKFDCDCRKPKTGMIDSFVEKYNIDIKESWFIGDTYRDVQTGVNAGLHTVLIPSDSNSECERYKIEPEYCVKTLGDAVDIILSQ